VIRYQCFIARDKIKNSTDFVIFHMHILIHLTGQILHIMFGKPKTSKLETKTGKMFIQ